MSKLVPLYEEAKNGFICKPCKPTSFPTSFVFGGISFIDDPDLDFPNQWFWHEHDGLEHGPYLSSGKAIYELYKFIKENHDRFHGVTGEGDTILIEPYNIRWWPPMRENQVLL